MSIEKSKKVSILWKRVGNNFMIDNLKTLAEPIRYIGSSISGVNKMLANGEELKYLMKNTLGVDPTSRDSNWDKLVAKHFHSFSVGIPASGKELEIGFKYDVGDPDRRDYITALMKSKSTITDDKTLASYVESGKVPEQEKYRYGTPINTDDYILWRYCLVFRDVANKAEDVDKSEHIRFYLWSSDEESRIKKESFRVKSEAAKLVMKVLEDEALACNIMYLLVDNKAIIDTNYKTLEDKHAFLYDYAYTKPADFIKVAKDKNITVRAEIERLIDANILRRVTNTTIITDATAPDVIIGHTMDEAVTYMTNVTDKTKVQISEYRAKLATKK